LLSVSEFMRVFGCAVEIDEEVPALLS
jgi:hypothetical protein